MHERDAMRRTELCVLGMPIAVDAPEPVTTDLLSALATRAKLTPGKGASRLTYELRPTPRGYHVVRIDRSVCELIDSADSVERAADLIADNMHPWVAQHHPDLLLVHAGAVEWDNIAIIMPGRSHAGKSSLVAALLRAGATYLSDEYAPIDRKGNVHPYARHISVRDADGSSTRVPPTRYATAVATDPVPLGVIVDTRYVPGASFEPQRLRGAVALLAVVDNALVARSRPEHTMRLVAGLAHRVEVLRSDRGDADEAAAVILEIVESIKEVHP